MREFPDVVLPYMAKPDTEMPYVVISPIACIRLQFSNRFRDHRSVSVRHTLLGHCRSDSPVLTADTYCRQQKSALYYDNENNKRNSRQSENHLLLEII